jgi:hypothetical protein
VAVFVEQNRLLPYILEPPNVWGKIDTAFVPAQAYAWPQQPFSRGAPFSAAIVAPAFRKPCVEQSNSSAWSHQSRIF